MGINHDVTSKLGLHLHQKAYLSIAPLRRCAKSLGYPNSVFVCKKQHEFPKGSKICC